MKATLGSEPPRHVYTAALNTVLDGLAVTPSGDTAIVGERGGACETRLRRVDLNSGAATTLFENATAPVLSPDGQFLAHLRVEDAPSCRERTVIRRLADGQERILAAAVPFVSRDGFAWSPDSTRLAFVDCREACTLMVHHLASNSTAKLGTHVVQKTTVSGQQVTTTLSVTSPVAWTEAGEPLARGRCECDLNGKWIVARGVSISVPIGLAVSSQDVSRVVSFAGSNHLVTNATIGASQTGFRRHGDGPLVDLGIRTNGHVSWPLERPWNKAVPARGSDGQPGAILATLRTPSW